MDTLVRFPILQQSRGLAGLLLFSFDTTAWRDFRYAICGISICLNVIAGSVAF
ncbi:hypothetical protein SAMN02745823_00437 [Sporobacter termitidis DSM 10068]|uniref:Uncharacterized protein n=1 Tax=Sporobacter termitidis DSM 10068 TaxID=1123282 RepID=A0A1M5UB64_9FIRM|nr:hypothetical protein SAMN02745823_00437 [Sporobacter termitidis DSM 10068]